MGRIDSAYMKPFDPEPEADDLQKTKRLPEKQHPCHNQWKLLRAGLPVHL